MEYFRPQPVQSGLHAPMRAQFTQLGLAATLLASPVAASAQPDASAAAAAKPEVKPEVKPPPSWRFRKTDRPVKVISLAGSVGAFRRDPYSSQIEQMCSAVEMRNISKTGLGAWALKKRFKDQVLGNRNLNFSQEGWEYWLLLSGGLNSVAMPERSARYFRDLFVLAHRRGMGVVALALTPWGDDKDKRWRTPVSALKYYRATRKLVNFIMGRLDPRDAMGRYVSKRSLEPDVPWDATERPDVAVDLYDSPMRDTQAAPHDVAAVRAALERDRDWQNAHANLTPEAREAKLGADAQEAANIPRWYMRPDLRAFDHIHPNPNGHRLMAQLACPKLPASWQCSCNEG
jgi:hypothetical protein